MDNLVHCDEIKKDLTPDMPQNEKQLPMNTGPDQIVIAAINRGYSTEFIEKMMDLQERHQKNIARQAFFDALANFKAEAPMVEKDKYNDWFKSRYTSLGLLLGTYNPILGKHGLSISFPPVEQTETTMTVACRLTHRMGHSEEIPLTAPIDKSAIGKESGKRSRNAIQDIKSTFTYIRSATCEAILGVAGTEGTLDDDGNHAGNQVEYINEEQLANIEALAIEVNADMDRFLKFYNLDELSDMPASWYNKAIEQLERKRQ